MDINQMSPSFGNLAVLSMCSYKAKNGCLNFNPDPNSRSLWVMMMVQNQYYILIPQCGKFSPCATFNFSHIFLKNWGRPNPYMSTFLLLCHVRGSAMEYNQHCNREVSKTTKENNVILIPRVKKQEGSGIKRLLLIIKNLRILTQKRKKTITVTRYM